MWNRLVREVGDTVFVEDRTKRRQNEEKGDRDAEKTRVSRREGESVGAGR